MNTLETIRMRQSCRLYRKQQITDRELDTILKAANAAPVRMGKYNEVRLTVIQNKELIETIDLLGAKLYKKANIHPTYGAPTIILISTIRPESNLNISPYCNAACIAENMMLAATEMGLGSVYLLGIITAMRQDLDICRKLKIPVNFMPISAVAVGKAGGRFKERKLTRDKIVTDIIK